MILPTALCFVALEPRFKISGDGLGITILDVTFVVYVRRTYHPGVEGSGFDLNGETFSTAAGSDSSLWRKEHIARIYTVS
jgi:hypothetical protein